MGHGRNNKNKYFPSHLKVFSSCLSNLQGFSANNSGKTNTETNVAFLSRSIFYGLTYDYSLRDMYNNLTFLSELCDLRCYNKEQLFN